MSQAREQILEVAGGLFSDRGYERVGINEIIAQAGVAKATFYAHFVSKQALLLSWLEGIAEKSKANNDAIRERKETLKDKVSLKFDQLQDYIEKTEYRGCPFSVTASQLETDNPVRDFICDYKEETQDFWHQLCTDAYSGPAHQAELVGDSLFLLYAGATAEAQNLKAMWPVESAKKMALQLCETLEEKTATNSISSDVTLL